MNRYKEIISLLKKQRKKVSIMESCTGGFIANAFTNIENSSSVFSFGAVTYANEYKVKFGVHKETIANYSVYSKEVANEMAYAISGFSSADYGVGITGKLGVPDPQNNQGLNNIVYISIYDVENKEYITQTLTVSSENRSVCKEEVSTLFSIIFLKYLNEKNEP